MNRATRDPYAGTAEELRERLRSVVRAGDIEGFRGLMTKGKQYLTTRTPR